jgi:transcriptional regulator with XRE-family HTH domain
MSKQGGWPATGFGARLRVLREGAALTQKDLAEKAGCHPMTLAKLERGVQEPAWPLVLALCRALGVPCEAFLPVAEGEPPETRQGRQAKVKEATPPKLPRGRPR